MDNYLLKINKLQIYSFYFIPFMLILVIISVCIALVSGRTLAPLLSTLVLWLAIFINWRRYLHKPVEIEESDNKVIFRDIFRREREVTITEIERIEVTGSKKLLISTSSEEIRGVAAFKDLPELISLMKNKNSQLITRGC